MGVFQNNLMGAAAAAASAGGSFYDHTIDNSIKVSNSSANSTATKYLYRDGGAGNRDTWTLGMWIKRVRIATSSSHTSMATWGQHSGSGSARGYGMVNDYTGTINGMSFENNNGSSWHLTTRTNAMYRDTAGWTHVCWRYDSTQATEADRARMYVNGELITNLQSTTYPAQNADHSWNSGGYQFIGTNGTGTNGNNPYQGFDGYIAEVINIDGTSLDPMDNLVETKNGVIIPKDPSGLTFGSEGFHLKFESSSDLGNDSSGNNNDFTVVGLSSFDQTTDTPTNNFCVINAVYAGDQTDANKYGTLSKGNLQHEFSSSSDAARPCTHKTPASGKWYFEYVITGGGGTGDYAPGAGIIDPNEYTMNTAGYNAVGAIQYANNLNKVYKGTSVSGTYSGSRGSNNDVMGIAVDMDNGAFYVSKNGTFQTIDGGSQGDPTSGASRTGAGATWTPASEFTSGMVPLSAPMGGSQPIIIMNFGQEGTFANIKTAGNNSDGNGHGNFFSAVPEGYLAICTANLSVADEVDPAQTDDDYPQKLFTALAYSGDGGGSQTTGFQPDLVWVKARNTGQSHGLFDSSRGTSKVLNSNSTSEEISSSGLTSFNSTGYTMGNFYNQSGNTYASWSWRANGGTTSTDSNGSVNSTVQADPSGSFSIVKFVGGISSAGTETIGHGLNKAPSFIINFCYDDLDGGDGNRWTRADGLTNWNYVLKLNATDDQIDKSGNGNMSAPTSTVFSINNTDILGAGSQKIISYCFANCEGYIKSGTYVGNGDTSGNGTFVYTGFKPAWVMVKKLAVNNWRIQDNARDPYNPAYHMLVPNSSAAEDAYTDGTDYNDFLSNGFKVARGGDAANWNADGATYLYLAMAHNPFKYATGR
jgi:hypothetical protein